MKFKNIKKKSPPAGGKNTESPSNSRTITENLKVSLPKVDPLRLLKLYGKILKILIVFAFTAAVVVVGMDFQKNLQIKQDIDFQREAIARDLSFWEEFLYKQQNYRDAYFQASILEYKLGNTPKAKMYAEKGLALDPNSENGRKLEKFLGNK